MSMSTVTPSDLVIISLPPDLHEDIIANISKEIPGNDLKVKHIGIAYDSHSAMGGLLEVIIEIVNSKSACAAIAAVLCKWVSVKNGKKIRLRRRGETIELSGLNSKEVECFLGKHAGDNISLEEINTK